MTLGEDQPPWWVCELRTISQLSQSVGWNNQSITMDGTLTGVKYLYQLKIKIGECITELGFDEEIWFMQDGCPTHNDT